MKYDVTFEKKNLPKGASIYLPLTGRSFKNSETQIVDLTPEQAKSLKGKKFITIARHQEPEKGGD